MVPLQPAAGSVQVICACWDPRACSGKRERQCQFTPWNDMCLFWGALVAHSRLTSSQTYLVAIKQPVFAGAQLQEGVVIALSALGTLRPLCLQSPEPARRAVPD